jgi:hypothetical protein
LGRGGARLFPGARVGARKQFRAAGLQVERREFDGYTANELGIISRFLERAIELTWEQLDRIRPDGSSSTVRELLP